MKQNKLHQFWPVLIGQFHNPEHELIKEELINFFKEYEKKKPKGNKQLQDKDYHGNYNLYQSHYDLHNEKNIALHKVLKFIAKSILETVKSANYTRLNKLEKKPEMNIKLKESWFIRYNQGGMIYPHNHGNHSWSCVYYVQASKEVKIMNGSTYFIKPYQGQRPNDFGSSYMESEQMTINAEEGKLLIFPGFLNHGSHPFKGKKDRIIISTNSLTELKK
ncbi:2OG-Fe(II) oxygenase family protein [Candidatus Pelagibacter sp.]|mgnify:FL=1|jgi:uncharacterized protein (TIGR02466 family)|nr:2OG-Fe(II) oxygenase family protein [Candidatus Pelagibacter sp.]